MNRDQLETHCGDSGVRLDLATGESRSRGYVLNHETNEILVEGAFEREETQSSIETYFVAEVDGKKFRSMVSREPLHPPNFPEPATDPWEEQE